MEFTRPIRAQISYAGMSKRVLDYIKTCKISMLALQQGTQHLLQWATLFTLSEARFQFENHSIGFKTVFSSYDTDTFRVTLEPPVRGLAEVLSVYLNQITQV